MSPPHRLPIDCAQAVALLTTACRDARRHIAIPIVRGFEGDAPLYRLEGSQGERQTRGDEHYDTIIVDQFLPPEGYPKRRESIICGNWLNLQYAGDYGATYAIFPFDGVPIGVAYGHEFLETRITVDHYRPGTALTIMAWNQLFKNMGLCDTSYAAFKADIARLRGAGGDIDALFPARVSVDDVLRDMYSSSRMRLQIVSAATIATIQDRQREMWFSGPCVAVRIDQLDDIKRML